MQNSFVCIQILITDLVTRIVLCAWILITDLADGTILCVQILMTSKFPFKLGPRVFQLLLDMFLCHHFSVINFVTAFEVSEALCMSTATFSEP